MTVTFALLRKPLQDNLFFLEWLLADRSDFLTKFRQGPEHFDLGRMAKELSKAMRIEIIGRAMDKTPAGRWISADALYEVRYEKSAPTGFDRLFNRGLHLVTTHKHYTTEPENINFIFANDDTRFGLWRYLYLWLPALLRHTLNVVRELFKTLDPEFEPFDHVAELWLTVGFLLCVEQEDADEAKNAAGEFFEKMFDEEPLLCVECGKRLTFDSANMLTFWEEGTVQCRSCNAGLQLLDPAELYGEDLADDPAAAPPGDS